MATSATLDRIGPNFSLPILIITVLYFCGLSFAATPRTIIGRQASAVSNCVQDCVKTQEAISVFCNQALSQRLEKLRTCASSNCGGNEEALLGLDIGLCKDEIFTPPSVTDVGTALVVATTSIGSGSTTLPSITPTAVTNSSNYNSGESTAANKKGSDLSIPVIVAIAVGGTVCLGICVGLWHLILCLKKRKRERAQKNVGNKGFDNTSTSDLVTPLGSASRKEIGRGAPWIDEENNNSTAHLHSMGVVNKLRPPPIATKPAPPVPPRPRGGLRGVPLGDVSPVSPVSPHSEYAAFGERRSKAISTVSSMKPERTHRDFYNVSSPPLPTPTSAVTSRYPSNRESKFANSVTGPGAPNHPASGYPLGPISPLFRNPSGKGDGTRSNLSTVEEVGSEGYQDMQVQGKPIPPEVIQRMSGLSQFNFGFGESQSRPSLEAGQKRESSLYEWAPENNSGELSVSPGQNKDKYLSGSSSTYSAQLMTPPPPITREAGPSTPEMFFGRSAPSYTPPPPPLATAGRSFAGKRQQARH